MKTITLTSTPKKIDLIRRLAKEMGINTKAIHELTDEEIGPFNDNAGGTYLMEITGSPPAN
jgi:hypothetical protein